MMDLSIFPFRVAVVVGRVRFPIYVLDEYFSKLG